MITIKLNGQELRVPEGTTALSLIPKDEQKDYYLCMVNGRVRELRYEINFDCELTLLKLDNPESGKAYEASLRFLMANAFYNLRPDLNIRFSYNVSRSIFCQVISGDFHLDRQFVDALMKEMHRLVEADLPIERITISKDEAIEYYEKYKLYDKIDILKFRPEVDVHIYTCGNYKNYMHSYMVPSTSWLQDYVIKPYSPGIIIQYPRYELGGVIPRFEEAQVYGRTLKKAYEWAKLVNAQTIYKINEKFSNADTTRDFVQVCETKHNNMLAELGEMIEKDIDNIRLIAIAGPSSSGKTTFSNRLRIELMSRGITPVMLSIDDYYLDRDKIEPNESGELDLEHINTLDVELFNQHMLSLINGEEAEIPRFDFTVSKRAPKGRLVRVPQNSPIIIEGIHALNELMSASIPKHQKFKIFISPQIQINIDNHSPMSTTDLRLIRRIVRDFQFRNSPANHTINMWPSVRRGEFKWIYPNQEQADYVFNSELSYELCVLKKYAIPVLREIKPNDKNFVIANRLLKYLKYFKTIDESAVPCNSLLREFIGGSCFKV